MNLEQLANKVQELATEHPNVTHTNCDAPYTQGFSCPGYSGCAVGVAIQQEWPESIGLLKKIQHRLFPSCDMFKVLREMHINGDLRHRDFLIVFNYLETRGNTWQQCHIEAMKVYEPCTN